MASVASMCAQIVNSRAIEVFFASVIPCVENKGAILLAASLNMKWYLAVLASALGSYVPVPFLLKLKTERIAAKSKLAAKLMANENSKHRQRFHDILQKYGHWGLFVVVSMPFTGIGCWLSALLANVAKCDKRSCAWAILLGNLVSSLITALAVYGVVSGIAFLIR